jgi:hypothetical protein
MHVILFTKTLIVHLKKDLSMKKSFFALALGALISTNSYADYLMELKDSSGTLLDSQCVKSYSYSNNSKSIDSPNKIRKIQKYSTNETLTNITYLDRPVYRVVIPVDGVYDRTIGNYPHIDYLVRQVINFRLPNGDQTFAGYTSVNYFANITLDVNKNLKIASNFASSWGYVGEVVIEYTKVNDNAISGNDSYKE